MGKKSIKRFIGLSSLAGVLLLTGCMPRVPAPQLPQEQNTTKRAMWQDTSDLEDHYSLKPEPYSLESGQKDPELLGPQSTIKRPLPDGNGEIDPLAETPPPQQERFLPKEEAPAAAPQTAVMTRSKCIDLIGKAKYDEYTKKFGSETAALRKCTILQRVQK